MIDPSQLCLHLNCSFFYLLNIIHFGTLQHLIVRDLVLPFDAHKVSEMPHVEGIQHLDMSTIAGPGLSPMQQGGEDCCPVYPDL